MNMLVPALLSNVVIVALLAIAVYAVTRIWRNPQLAHALWVLVLLKLVTPPLVNVPLPEWFPKAELRQPFATNTVGAQTARLASENEHRAEPQTSADPDGISSITGVQASFVARPALESTDSMRAWDCDWSACLLWAWAAGSLLIAGVGINRIRRFAGLVAATEFADGQIQEDADEIARELGMPSTPSVRIVHGAIPPVVWSVGFRPVILLPTALLAQLERDEIRSILAHELAHVKRLDHWVRWLEALVVVLYWWNPIVWLVRRELNVAEESCCDRWVVWLVPERRRTYATAIVQTVEFLAAARAVLPVAASGMARSFPLKTRVTAILDEPKAHRMSWPLRVSVVAAALAGLPLSAIPSPATIAATETVAADDNPTDAGAAAVPAAEQEVTDAKPSLRGRLFVRGFWWRSDRLAGKMAIASIDPATGDWKPLVEDSDNFAVTPDGKTIFFNREGALWNGDAQKNENPGKVFAESGHVVFAPDGKSMLVTTWKRKADKPEEYETTVWKMGIDGTSAVPIVDLARWGGIRDWSPDGKWLLAEKDQLIHLVSPDGKESRLLLKSAHCAQFSPDGQRVVHTIPWKGKIRVIDIDGANDRPIVELPNMIYAHPAYFSPEGKHVASVLMDLAFGNDGVTPVLYADPAETHPRIAIFDAATGEQRTLTLPRQNDWDFFPTGEMEWR